MNGNRALVATLIAGILLGAVFGRLVWGRRVHAERKEKKQSNDITVIVYSDKKIYFTPETGDTIHWLRPTLGRDGFAPVFAHFGESSPCIEGSDTSTCTIKEKAVGQYTYNCTDKYDPKVHGAKILCTDPGIDPNSSTGGGDRFIGREIGAADVAVKSAGSTQTPQAAQGFIGREANAVVDESDTDLRFDLSCPNGKLQITTTPKLTPGGTYHTVTKGILWTNRDFTPSITIPSSTAGGGEACSLQHLGSQVICTIDSVNNNDLKKSLQVTMKDPVPPSAGGCSGTSTASVYFKR